MRNIHNTALFSNTAMTADRESAPIDVSHCPYASVHLVWTGTPAGTFRLQGSNDAIPAGTDPNSLAYSDLTWIDIDTQAAGGAAGSKYFDIVSSFKWLAVQYDFTSSTGTITVHTAFTKGLGSN